MAVYEFALRSARVFTGVLARGVVSVGGGVWLRLRPLRIVVRARPDWRGPRARGSVAYGGP